MYLLEHDAKELLARHGIPVPPGCMLRLDGGDATLPDGPWVVKGQITAGGRGKAGIIRKAGTTSEVRALADALLGTTVKGHVVRAVRVERQMTGCTEAYAGMLLDTSAGGVRVIMAARGGVEVESLPADEVRSELAAPEREALLACVRKLARRFDGPVHRALGEAGERLAEVFIELEAMMIEINPLFVDANGRWMAGDAKFVTDDNALGRQPELAELLTRRATDYPEAALKLNHGFDYVVVDPAGELGLLTTGAGLSMMLIDELRAAGIRPYNFLDIRTGGLRGETARLVSVLSWIAAGPRVRAVLVNIFAGITDLGEFSGLLVKALSQVPQLRVPVVARLVGNGLPAARMVLAQAGVTLYTDLDAALAEVRTHLGNRK